MLYREIIAVCSEIHTKHINTLCGQNVELLNVKLAVHTKFFFSQLPMLRLSSRINLYRESHLFQSTQWKAILVVNKH